MADNADNNAETVASLIELAGEITIAWLQNPNVNPAAQDVPAFLKDMHAAISDISSDKPGEPEAVTYEPAAPIRSSVKPDHIVSLIDGKKYKMLKRHLSQHGLTPAEYRERFGLKPDYPMVAPAYAELRREVAKKLGLGRKPTASQAEPVSEAAPVTSAKPKRAAAKVKAAAVVDGVVEAVAPAVALKPDTKSKPAPKRSAKVSATKAPASKASTKATAPKGDAAETAAVVVAGSEPVPVIEQAATVPAVAAPKAKVVKPRRMARGGEPAAASVATPEAKQPVAKKTLSLRFEAETPEPQATAEPAPAA
jgi:predicted transcriptional regulator